MKSPIKICSICNKSIEGIPHPDSGYIFPCDYCYSLAVKKRHKVQAQRWENEIINNWQVMLAEAGVPRRFLNNGCHLNQFELSIKSLVDNRYAYFIYGDVGVGKSHLAAALMRDYLFRSSQRPSIKFSTVAALLGEIKRAITKQQRSTTEEDIIKRFSRHDLLVLDDIGAKNNTQWAIDILFRLIDYRYASESMTIFTSNLSINDLSLRLHDCIASRIIEMCEVVSLKGDDRRLNDARKRL